MSRYSRSGSEEIKQKFFQFGQAERFFDQSGKVQVSRFRQVILVRKAGHQKKGCLQAQGTDARKNLDAVHVGHAKVAKNDVWLKVVQGPEALKWGFIGAAGQSHGVKLGFENFQDQWFIVNDENSMPGGHRIMLRDAIISVQLKELF
ncbi:MAG: hypothetical protein A2X94_10050 [Bdellovibrionales bacterium GWB1_55_8]|nr:MAG: hypothetical protein A2X94_10050 [Bdellovibrionales bacterium GWB1_55_8]